MTPSTHANGDIIFGATDDALLMSFVEFPRFLLQKLETISKIGLRQMSSGVVPQIHPEFGDDLPVSLGGNRGQTHKQTNTQTNLSQILV